MVARATDAVVDHEDSEAVISSDKKKEESTQKAGG
jgi:hypothetical protein